MFNLRQLISFVYYMVIVVWVSRAGFRPVVSSWELDVLLLFLSCIIAYDSNRKSTTACFGRVIAYAAVTYHFILFVATAARAVLAVDFSDPAGNGLRLTIGLFSGWLALLTLALSLNLLKFRTNAEFFVQEYPMNNVDSKD
jgi:hypothetical protein